MASVLFVMLVVFAFWIPYFPDPDFRSHVLQLAIPIDLTGQAIEGVIGQYQFNDILSQFPELFRIGENMLSFLYRRMA